MQFMFIPIPSVSVMRKSLVQNLSFYHVQVSLSAHVYDIGSFPVDKSSRLCAFVVL